MISFKTLTAICLGATLCTAQPINISGIVKDTAGVGISGATVKLEKANISATSGTGGIFTLAGSVSSIKPPFTPVIQAASPIQLQNGKITFTLSGNTVVAISVYNVCGRQIYKSKKMYGFGIHAIATPLQSTGIFIYAVNIGNNAYCFKSVPMGTSSIERMSFSRGMPTLAKQSKTTAVINDVIAATKIGWLNYRCVIGNSDTSGVVIKMIANAGNVTDVEGDVYQSVRIGNQVWMTENLRVTKYSDGTPIALVSDSVAWREIHYSELTTPAYCFYNNTTNADSIKKYGALYNWYVVSSANPKKIAPTGWHVPSDAEWDTLQNYLIANGYNWDGTTTGNKIAKALCAKTDWQSYSVNGSIGKDLTINNSSGFSALPGGSRYITGIFDYQTSDGGWWSATERERVASRAWYRDLHYEFDAIASYGRYKGCGFSVRLLRD